MNEYHIEKLVDVFEVNLTKDAGVYIFSEFPKCGPFWVDLNSGVIRMRWDQVAKFSSERELLEQLVYWWDWWSEEANFRGCPYVDTGQKGKLEALLKELYG